MSERISAEDDRAELATALAVMITARSLTCLRAFIANALS